MRRILPLFLLLALPPTAASAVTVPEIVALAKAGVSEEVLVAMIDRDKAIFALDAGQVIALKHDGVSEKIVIAMLKSGREEPRQTASAGAASCAATEPLLITVGHGPERPNTYHDIDKLGGFVYPPQWPIIYQAPYVVGIPAAPSPRTLAGCGDGQRAGSGPRRSADQADCRRSR